MLNSPLYSQVSLPPNLKHLEAEPQLHFSLKVSNLVYLQKAKETVLRIKWWGQNETEFFPFDTKIVYSIYSSKAKFLKYCDDMQVLSLEVCEGRGSRVLLCRGILNLKLISGWQGQAYQTTLDLIQNKKKVGQILVTIEISQLSNGLQNRFPSQRPTPKYEIQSNRGEGQFQSTIKPSITKPTITKRSPSQSAKSIQCKRSVKILQQSDLESAVQSGFGRPYKRSQRDLIRQEFGSCICSRLNNYNSEAQLMKLKEDYDLIFGVNNPESYQEIELEFIKWNPSFGNEINESIAVIEFPLPNGKKNRYELSSRDKNAVRIKIDNNHYTEKDIQLYVRQAIISISIDSKYSGKIELSKLLSHCGQQQIVPMSILDQKVKNSANNIKGHCILRVTPPIQRPIPQKPQQQTHKNHENQSRKQHQRQKHGYTWIYVNQFHPLQQNFFQNSNIFIRVTDKSETIQCQTVWKCATPLFNYIMTLQLKQSYVLQLWDRQKKPLLVGVAEISAMFKWEENLPVISIRGEVIGYLTVCMGLGSLIDANKFLQLHMKKKPISPPNVQVKHPEYESMSEKNHSGPEREASVQSSSFTHKISQHSESKQNVIDNIGDNRKPHTKKPKQSSLSLLELHNIIFTRMLNVNDVDSYRENSQKLSQFQSFIRTKLNVKLPPWAISKVASFYLHPQNNKVRTQQFYASFDAFLGYYKDLQEFRDEIVRQFLQQIQQIGLSINLLQSDICNFKNFWTRLRETVPNSSIVQKLRIYYDQCNYSQLCDALRKFQVYEKTFGELLPSQQIRQYMTEQLCDLLDLNKKDFRFRQQIRKSQIELSKWEELNLLDFSQEFQQKKEGGFIKCPTFGLLGLQNMPQRLEDHQQQEQYNPSILANISPIYASNQLVMLVSSCEFKISKLMVNGQSIQLTQDDSAINLKGIQKQFRYTVVLKLENNILYETEGPFNEWMGLVDDHGEYGGCVKITQREISDEIH